MPRMRSWVASGPSSETITSSHQRTICSAWRASSNPLDSSEMVSGRLLSRSHKCQRLGCIRASPPESATSETPSSRKSSTSLSTVAASIEVPVRLAFQMSHMTQRQLHLLCGISVTTGSLVRRRDDRQEDRTPIAKTPGFQDADRGTAAPEPSAPADSRRIARHTARWRRCGGPGGRYWSGPDPSRSDRQRAAPSGNC